MSQTEFITCPKCGKGKLVPTGKVTSSHDPNTGKETVGKEYKCDNCGYIEVGYDRTFEVNEQLIITDSPSPPPADDNNKRNKDNSNSRGSGGGNGDSDGGVQPAASSSSSCTPYPNELNDRVHFKLNAAWRHLDNLIRLENEWGSLAAPNIRVEAEQRIDECLYHLAGVNDALLQQVNTQLKLGLATNRVKLETMNPKLHNMGKDAEDIIAEIKSMLCDSNDRRWLINDCHNQSEHRSMIGQALVVVDGVLQRASLIDPRLLRESLENPSKKLLILG